MEGKNNDNKKQDSEHKPEYQSYYYAMDSKKTQEQEDQDKNLM